MRVGPCLQSCCLAKRWSNLLQYDWKNLILLNLYIQWNISRNTEWSKSLDPFSWIHQWLNRSGLLDHSVYDHVKKITWDFNTASNTFYCKTFCVPWFPWGGNQASTLRSPFLSVWVRHSICSNLNWFTLFILSCYVKFLLYIQPPYVYVVLTVVLGYSNYVFFIGSTALVGPGRFLVSWSIHNW
jgi:hypothetical protein